MNSKRKTFSRKIRFENEASWKKLKSSLPDDASCSYTVGENVGSVTFFGEDEDKAATRYFKWATANNIIISANPRERADYSPN